MEHPYDFRVPDFRGDVDVAAHIARVPENATCKGLFFRAMLVMRDGLPPERARQVKLERPRYLPFLDYPLVEHMRLSDQLIPLLFPGIPTRSAYRQMGWRAFPDLAGTMLGRAVFGHLGAGDVAKAFELGPRGLKRSIDPGFAEVTVHSDRHVWLEYYDIYGMLDPYYIGVVEGTVRHYGEEPQVRIHTIDPANAVIDIRW